MNKELEEAKGKIGVYIHDWVDNSTDEDGYTKYEINEEEQGFFEAIETVLQALKNSIPKEKVKESIEKARIKMFSTRVMNKQEVYFLDKCVDVINDIQEELLESEEA